MVACYFPLQYVIAASALWLNRQQQEVIDYLKEENRLLKEKVGDRKLHFTDAERHRLGQRPEQSCLPARFSLSSIRWSRQTPCCAGTEY